MFQKNSRRIHSSSPTRSFETQKEPESPMSEQSEIQNDTHYQSNQAYTVFPHSNVLYSENFSRFQVQRTKIPCTTDAEVFSGQYRKSEQNEIDRIASELQCNRLKKCIEIKNGRSVYILGNPKFKYAIKMFNINHDEYPHNLNLYKTELYCLKSLREKPNILELEREIENGNHNCFVLPFRYPLVYGRKDEHTVRDIMKGVLNGLKSVHDNGIVHGDIKEGNILYENSIVYLFDFGSSFSKSDSNHDTHLLTRQQLIERKCIVGTRGYNAPETFLLKCTNKLKEGNILKNAEIDYQIDFWSLGVTLYRLLSGELPFSDYDSIEVLLEKYYEFQKKESVWKNYSPQVRNLFCKLTKIKPSNRPQSVDEIFSHEWFHIDLTLKPVASKKRLLPSDSLSRTSNSNDIHLSLSQKNSMDDLPSCKEPEHDYNEILRDDGIRIHVNTETHQENSFLRPLPLSHQQSPVNFDYTTNNLNLPENTDYETFLNNNYLYLNNQNDLQNWLSNCNINSCEDVCMDKSIVSDDDMPLQGHNNSKHSIHPMTIDRGHNNMENILVDTNENLTNKLNDNCFDLIDNITYNNHH